MKLIELFSCDATALNVKAKDKDAVINKLVDLQFTHGNITDKEAYKKAIYAREAEFSTYVGEGIAVPHAKTDVVTAPSLAVVRLAEPIQYNEDDDDKSSLFFMIAAPMNGNLHVDMLARMMSLLANEEFVAKLNAAKTPQEFLDLIAKEEEQNFGNESFTEEEVPQAGYRILCVTACPTGIAHTYMAAENLQKAGAAMGIPTKVETNGSGGVKNALTAEEIAKCDGIIIAADKNVEMARFDGKPVIKVKVSDGIHKSQELIERAVKGDGPIYHHEGGKAASTASEGDESFGRQIYKHLMNGVSNMLPFVIGGGILIAIAFLLDDYSIDPSNFGMNTPMAAFFKTAGGVAFNFMLPILAGFIAMSIADRPGLMVGFAGGAIASAGTTFASCFNSDITVISGGFLGALFAGFLAGYLVLALEKITEKMPSSMDGLRPMLIYPVAGLLLISVIMFAINPFFSWLNQLLADALNSLSGTNSILLGLIIGGMMSIDMGGPFNKAAYVFGTASLAYQTDAGYMIMAAVMVAGMVPPIAIAIASWVFKNKFTDNDRKTAPVNAIMGLCFISEAAIPYAAGDPLHVIPSCVIGSAVAGALSMAFKCTLMAPHGGIFVFPVVGNPLMYIIALAIGSIVGAVMLGLLRKPVESK